MAECQSPSSAHDLQHHSVDCSYPTHLEGATVSTCLTAKTDKYPPNGVTRMSPELNGFINFNADHKQRNKEDPHCENADDLQCCKDVQERQSSATDCNCNKSSDISVSQISPRLQSLDICAERADDKDIYNGIEYVVYVSEVQMSDIMRLITKDLSEPYSIYTYRYFIHNWPKLCFLVSTNAMYIQIHFKNPDGVCAAFLSVKSQTLITFLFSSKL